MATTWWDRATEDYLCCLGAWSHADWLLLCVLDRVVTLVDVMARAWRAEAR